MRIAISGATGLIGSAFAEHARRNGDQVLRLVRRTLDAPAEPGCIHWEPETGRVDTARLAGVGTVLHLAGENIAGLWTAAKKRRIRDSRVVGTRTLCAALAAMDHPPTTLLAASAIGFYGDRGDEELTEESPAGTGFLAEVCREWEAATAPAAERGIRVVNMRTGIVLSREGGALKQMLTPFKLGIGGRIGNGRQYMSWIALRDVVHAVDFLSRESTLDGPVNLTAPDPVTNARFTAALARALRRPALLPLPAFVARHFMGEMGRELLLSSARVAPARLTAAGFRFQHERIDEAMNAAWRIE